MQLHGRLYYGRLFLNLLLSVSGNALSFLQVLFPLLDSVKKQSDLASDEKVDSTGSMLIHHSRNTAQKQWAETQVDQYLFYCVYCCNLCW